MVGGFEGFVGNLLVGWRLWEIGWRLCWFVGGFEGVCWKPPCWLEAFGDWLETLLDSLDALLGSLDTSRVLLETSLLVGGFGELVGRFTGFVGGFEGFVGNLLVGWRLRGIGWILR
ncbi:hypothetical protein [Sporosarcina sp. E16_8]|uniref:hypothetical protein n=1 Tax=Sporosarcina sp. E16_8 TaxID=2789295 RepID=UPI001A92AF41|nr:hypothetical protein [Sporosarcina sp. E16_8]MBO0589156.1 hypothetical protein [Sporosarcina sp. E16_8]